MGFRSTITSQDYYIETMPVWFKDKYPYFIYGTSTCLTMTEEKKLYEATELFEDYQKALIEVGALEKVKDIVCVVLAEDNTITKVTITVDKIIYNIMNDGMDYDGVWAQ